MSYYNYAWKPYVPVAARRREAEKVAAKAGAALAPVAASRGAIARTFWGKAWCDNLERYSDYANRLPRGRTYLRNGSVIDLQIGAGEVRAQVVGSSLYRVTIGVAAVPGAQWRAIGAECSASIDSLVELLQGRLSTAVMQCICRPGTGLFPTPREIKLDCSCPDWADMCKHVAAVLYGVGARLDQRPELLFELRRVAAKDLVASAGAGLQTKGKGPAKGKVLADAGLAEMFGIDIDAGAAPAERATPGGATVRAGRKAPVKAAAKAKAAAPVKAAAVARPGAAPKRPVAAKRPAAAKAGPARAAPAGKATPAKRKAPGKKVPAAAKSSAAKTGTSSTPLKKSAPRRRG